MPHEPAFKIAGRIEEGKVKVRNTARWAQIKQHFNGRNVMISVEEWYDKRTLSQNALYWLYLSVIESETGEDANRLHELFKCKFIPSKFVQVLGEEVAERKSTTKMDKLEFGEYLDKICAMSGVPIPHREEVV